MPTQATNTTSGNWRARYASGVYDKRGRHWRVELIDHTTTNAAASEFNLTGPSYTPHDVELAEDGFTLQWDGPSDHVGSALIPSSCEVTFAITTSAMEPLVSVIKGQTTTVLVWLFTTMMAAPIGSLGGWVHSTTKPLNMKPRTALTWLRSRHLVASTGCATSSSMTMVRRTSKICRWLSASPFA